MPERKRLSDLVYVSRWLCDGRSARTDLERLGFQIVDEADSSRYSIPVYLPQGWKWDYDHVNKFVVIVDETDRVQVYEDRESDCLVITW
jgi:hypothetical protein